MNNIDSTLGDPGLDRIQTDKLEGIFCILLNEHKIQSTILRHML